MLLILFGFHAHVPEDTGDGLRIVAVHLAAKGGEVVALGRVRPGGDLPGQAALGHHLLGADGGGVIAHGRCLPPE